MCPGSPAPRESRHYIHIFISIPPHPKYGRAPGFIDEKWPPDPRREQARTGELTSAREYYFRPQPKADRLDARGESMEGWKS